MPPKKDAATEAKAWDSVSNEIHKQQLEMLAFASGKLVAEKDSQLHQTKQKLESTTMALLMAQSRATASEAAAEAATEAAGTATDAAGAATDAATAALTAALDVSEGEIVKRRKLETELSAAIAMGQHLAQTMFPSPPTRRQRKEMLKRQREEGGQAEEWRPRPEVFATSTPLPPGRVSSASSSSNVPGHQQNP